MSKRERRSSRRLVAGIALMGFASASLLFAPAVAQEGDEQAVEITESALYVASPMHVIPRTLTSDVPPTAICVVAPDFCPEELDPVRDPLRDLAGEVAGSDVPLPAQLVPPDSVAISYLGGNPRYQSAIKFDVPPPPAGEEYIQFELILPQGQPTFDLNSPAFRRIILGVFAAIGRRDDPGEFMEVLTEALADALTPPEGDQDHPGQHLLDVSQTIGVEACPFTQPFEPEGAPQAKSDEEIPAEEDEFGGRVLAIDCVLGTSGMYDAGAEVWRFDLAFAADAWSAGDLQNHGVLLRPIGAPNLAFGDPDTSTNAQVVLDITDVKLASATAPEPEPFDFDPPPEMAGGELTFDDPAFLDAPAPADDFAFDDPMVADDPLAAQPPAVADQPPPTAAAPARGEAINPWWMWLLVPVFMGGAYLTTAALAGSPALAAGASSGAMTRLIAQRNGTTTPMTQV